MEAKALFASGNRHKFHEMHELLRSVPLSLVFGPDVTDPVDVDEDGTTYAQNALKKARAWSETTGYPSLADDSGLEVLALDWAPGIRSARLAPTVEERISRLLQQLQNHEDRTARFVAALAYVEPKAGRVALSLGYVWGEISFSPEGSGGFGYDPVFIPRGFDKPFAALDGTVKGEYSHRVRACRSLADMLF
ncbi:MAG: non-canonical purine NTP pyrophosphatase [Synergistales bacterium]|nr:non-canonical purine NTP pyrophosphatase [Synergistales bacterium]